MYRRMVVSFIATYILFGIYAKQGKLDAEETGIEPDTSKVKETVKSAGCSMQTFTVITEVNDDDKITFMTSGNVKSGQKVNA